MKHYVFAYMYICEMETEREGGMRFTNSILEPQHYQTPKCFVFGCARTHTHTHIHFDTNFKPQLEVSEKLEPLTPWGCPGVPQEPPGAHISKLAPPPADPTTGVTIKRFIFSGRKKIV